MKKLLTTYLPVWEQQFIKIKDLIKEEIKKPKKDRKKAHLKMMLKECRELKKLINSINETNNEIKKKCPHCGGSL